MKSMEGRSSNKVVRKRIMDAAARLFAEKGYTETTTLAIAREAGVNESSIFRNFGSKRNLYVEIFCANTPGAEDILLAGLTYGEDLEKDLSLMFKEYIGTCVQHLPNYRLSVQQIDDLQDSAFYLESANRFESMKTQMIAYLNELKRMGRVADTDCEALSEYLFSLFLIKAPQFVKRGQAGLEVDERAQEEFAQECTEYVYKLLAVK